MPEMFLQCGAAETSKMGRPLSFAAARPLSHVPYQPIDSDVSVAPIEMPQKIKECATTARRARFMFMSQEEN